MIVKFHPEAWDEFDGAIDFYEAQSPGLGARFEVAIERSAALIGAMPYGWPSVGHGVRKYVIKRFPYLILFTIEDEFALIVAVAHQSREPKYWKQRVD